MSRIKRVLLGGFAVLVLCAAVLGGIASRTLPRTQGVVMLSSPLQPAAVVRIERDAAGIPTIRASGANDASFGLGFAHAQDRLWQMETHRRIGAGRLAEVFGPGALDTDRFLRALAVRHAAAAQWQRMPPETRAAVQAYADGVNAFIAGEMRVRPPEFLMLSIEPEPWTPLDTVAWTLMMAWDLGGNWSTELLRLRLALQMPQSKSGLDATSLGDTVARIDQLLPPVPGDSAPLGADYAALYRSLGLGSGGHGDALRSWLRLPQVAPPSGIEGVGSNNWVIAGSHTTTGHPLLANDPHLKLSTPALWYLARIEMPGLSVAGATLPGVPGVVLGQNEHLAWGFTNTGPDVQDLYIEAVEPQDASRYRTPDGSHPFETSSETIRVKGAADVSITVRRTRHGPVISDAGIADDLLGPATASRHVLALRWTALDADNDTLTPALRMQAAASVDDFIGATRSWVAPMQNMVVADRAGRIAMVAAGRVPVRRPDNDLHGRAPGLGWDARYDWDGWVPTDQTPREIDPARGFIATANQRITPPGYPYYIGSEWALPYRQQRIEQLLRSRPRHSLADMAAMQGDIRSLAALALLPHLQAARSNHPLAAAARAQLQGFDGTMNGDRAAPLIFWAWQRELAIGIFKDDVGDALWQKALASRTLQDALEGVLGRDDSTWCDDRDTPVVESCAVQVDAALTRALDALQQHFGTDVSRWQWQQAHAMRAEHRPFSRVPLLAPFFELRAPVGGDTHTVNVSRVGLRPDPVTGELYLDEHGPSLRAIYDIQDPRQSQVIHSSGQSGIVFSPRYRSFLPLWTHQRYVPLWSSDATTDVLVLQPTPR